MRNFRLDDESGHQEALFSWAAYRTGLMPELQYMYHVPNGGKRDKATAAVLKRQGVKAGGTECWNWGGKFAGQKCPQSDACEHWRTCEMCNGVMGQCKKKQRIEKAR